MHTNKPNHNDLRVRHDYLRREEIEQLARIERWGRVLIVLVATLAAMALGVVLWPGSG